MVSSGLLRRFLQEPHGVTTQKTPFFIVTAVKTSNLTRTSLACESGSARLGSDRVGSGRVGSGRVVSGRVGSCRVVSCRVGSCRVVSGRVGSGRVGSGSIKPNLSPYGALRAALGRVRLGSPGPSVDLFGSYVCGWSKE
jgi:hypothetical protein